MDESYRGVVRFAKDLLDDVFFRGLLCCIALVFAGMVLARIMKAVASRAYYPEIEVIDLHLV